MRTRHVAVVSPPRSHPLDAFHDMLVTHLPEVHRAVRSLARRHRLPAEEEGDLLSEVLVRLVADDYAVLRKYRGQSALATYLRVVAYRVLLDSRIRRWGKWRPSRRAVALGSAAVRLERLVGREGLTEREALSALKDRADERLDPNVAHAIAARAGRRGRMRELPLELGAHAAVDALQERVLESRDLARSAVHAAAVIRQALRALSNEDYEFLHRRFVLGESVADLARRTGVDQKRLYRRHEQILRRLRLDLGAARIVRHDLRALIGHPDVEVPGVFEERLSA